MEYGGKLSGGEVAPATPTATIVINAQLMGAVYPM
jgi:hypothetical protein